jgi:O-antigen/teichoic acid export membrane protein
MSRTHRFLGGLAMTYGYQALLVLAGLWLTPFYLGHIGKHDYGLWLVGTQLLAYLTLTDFGVVALLPLETAYATGRAGGFDKAKDLPILVGQTVRLVLYQLPIVILVAAIMWFSIPAEWQGLKGPLAVVLLAFVIGFPLRILPALLQGLQDLAFANGLQIVGWLASTVCTVFMVLAGWSLYALALGWLVSQLALTPLFLFRLRSRFREILPRELPPLVWSAARARLAKGSWVSVAQIAQMLMSASDFLIVGRLLGPAAVVPYSCTAKLPGVLGNQANILMQTAEPALAELKVGAAPERIIQVLIALSQGVLTFTGFVFSLVLIVNHWFVDWWVAPRHYGSQYGGLWLTLAFVTTMVVRHWTAITAYSVFCFGYQRRISLTNLSDGLVTVGTCLVLVKMLGVIGAPLGSLAGACLVSLPMNLRLIARDMKVSVPQLVHRMLQGWIWRFALIGGAVICVSVYWYPKRLPEAIGAATLTGLLYGAIMLPNLLRAPLSNYLQPLAAAFRTKIGALQMRTSV